MKNRNHRCLLLWPTVVAVLGVTTKVFGFSYLDSLSSSTPPPKPSKNDDDAPTEPPKGHYSISNPGAGWGGYKDPKFGGYLDNLGSSSDNGLASTNTADDSYSSGSFEAGKKADYGDDVRWGSQVYLDSMPSPSTNEINSNNEVREETSPSMTATAVVTPIETSPEMAEEVVANDETNPYNEEAALQTRDLFLEKYKTQNPFATVRQTQAPTFQQAPLSLEPTAAMAEASSPPARAVTGTDASVALETNSKNDEVDEEEMSETQKLMKQVKEAGTAGVISYALWELGFWALSVPVCAVGYYQYTGHWPDLSDPEDQKKLGAEAFAFVNVARFAVPLRIGLALGTTPWIDENIVKRFGTKQSKEEEEM